MSAISKLIDSVIDMPGEFVQVIENGPNILTQSVLILFGALLVFVPSLVLAYLTLGAGIDLLRTGVSGATHPEE